MELIVPNSLKKKKAACTRHPFASASLRLRFPRHTPCHAGDSEWRKVLEVWPSPLAVPHREFRSSESEAEATRGRFLQRLNIDPLLCEKHTYVDTMIGCGLK